jgi:hypothetical protein
LLFCYFSIGDFYLFLFFIFVFLLLSTLSIEDEEGTGREAAWLLAACLKS